MAKIECLELPDFNKERIEDVLGLIECYGRIDGGHHKQWLLDQILRTLLAEGYNSWVDEYNAYGEGAYPPWDVGIPP